MEGTPDLVELVGMRESDLMRFSSSSNIDAGVNIGTIFGIYKVKDGSVGTVDDVLRPGKEMVAGASRL